MNPKNTVKTIDETNGKKKILLIGNCQTCVAQFLQTIPEFQSQYVIELVEVFKANPTTSPININNFDIIITQPILETFENFPEFQTKNIISQISNHKTKLIMFPVCYFDFNFPFLESEKGAYKETSIEKIYNSNLSQYSYYDMVCDTKLLDYSIMIYRLNKSFTSLENREIEANHKFKTQYMTQCNIACDSKSEFQLENHFDSPFDFSNNKNNQTFYFIKVSEFIRENFRHNLFYTFNHPNKILLSFIAYKILVCLGIFKDVSSFNYLDYLIFPKTLDPLNSFVCPIYKCFQPFFEINIDEYNKNLCFKGARPCNITKFFRYYLAGSMGVKKIKKSESYHLPNKNISYNMMNVNCTIKKCVAPKKKNNLTTGKSTLVKMSSNIDVNASPAKSIQPNESLGTLAESTDSTTNATYTKKNFTTSRKKLPGKLVKQKSCNSNF